MCKSDKYSRQRTEVRLQCNATMLNGWHLCTRNILGARGFGNSKRRGSNDITYYVKLLFLFVRLCNCAWCTPCIVYRKINDWSWICFLSSSLIVHTLSCRVSCECALRARAFLFSPCAIATAVAGGVSDGKKISFYFYGNKLPYIIYRSYVCRVLRSCVTGHKGGIWGSCSNVRYHFAACKLSLRLFRHEKQWLNVIFLTHSLYTLFFSIRCERES